MATSNNKYVAVDLIKQQLRDVVLKEIEDNTVAVFKRELDKVLNNYRNELRAELAKISFEKIGMVSDQMALSDELRILIKIEEEEFRNYEVDQKGQES